MNPSPADPHFPPTRWSQIARLKSSDEEVAARALNEICEDYRYPLYCYIRRHGFEHHDADDALQEFMVRLLKQNALEAADAAKGRLRALLATALSRFLINWRRDAHRRNRVVDLAFSTTDEARYQMEQFTDHDTPERVFERKWAQQLLQKAVNSLRADFATKGKLELFRALRPALLGGGSLLGQDVRAMAEPLGMSEGAFRVAFSRLLRDYRTVLQAEVRQTVAEEHEVQEEMGHLVSMLAA